MDRTPRVSVILPTHNRAALLKEAIESVLAQTYQDWELIIIDDESTDETELVARAYVLKDERIRYVRQAKQGVSAARNAGIRLARGVYIALLDSDDTWLPEKLTKQVALFERHPEVGLVSGTMHVIDETGTVRAIKPKIWQEERSDLFRRGSWVTSSVMIRRACLEGIEWFDTRLAVLEDHDLYVRLCRRHRELFLREPMGRYRQHSANTVADALKVQQGQVLYWMKVLQEYGLSPQETRFARSILARSLYLLGKAHYRRGHFDLAVQRLFQAAQCDPAVGRRFMEPNDSWITRGWKLVKPWLVIVPAAWRALGQRLRADERRLCQPQKATVLYVETGSGFGGSGQCLHALLLALDRSRFRPLVVAYGHGTAIRQIQELGIPVRVVAHQAGREGGYATRLWNWGTREVPLAIRFARLIRREGVSLVHINNDLYSGIAPLLAAKLTRRPVVCHIRVIRAVTRLERWLGRRVDAMVTITRGGEAFYRRVWPTGRITMIYDAINSSSMPHGDGSLVRAQLGIPSGVPLIGLIARCVPGKGYEEFVQAADFVRRQLPQARFLIIGNGAGGDAAHEAAMRALAQRVGLNGALTWGGWRDDVATVLRELDLVVQASSTFPEGFGRVLLEAMVHERPIVATSIPAFAEVVGDAGVLVAPGNPDSLAEEIVRLLRSPELRQQLVDTGRRRVRELFSLNVHIQRIEALYESLLRSGECGIWSAEWLSLRTPNSALRTRHTPHSQLHTPNFTRRLRIAWCHNGVIGGAKRAAHAMVSELVRRGHIVDEIVLSDAPSDYLPLRGLVRESMAYPIGKIAPQNRLRPYVVHAYGQLVGYLARRPGLERAFQRIANDINERKYDVVHIDQHPFCHALGLLPYLRVPSLVYVHAGSGVGHTRADWQPHVNGHGRLTPTPKVLVWGLKRWYTRSCEQALAWKDELKHATERRRLSHAGAMLSNSDFSREALFQTYGYAPTTCYLGVDPEMFRPLHLSSEPMVLSVGRLVWMKQHHLVIEAVGTLDPSRRPRVVIATPERQGNEVETSLTLLAHRLQVDLTIAYASSESELARLYNRALALIAVPVMEPLGLVVLEAMACGTPVIGVREGGIRELIAHSQTGLLVERDLRRIAEAITVLQQPQARARMGREAAQTVRARWTWQHTIDRYEQELYALVRSSEFGVRNDNRSAFHIPHSTLRGGGNCS